MKFLKSFWITLKEYIHSNPELSRLNQSDILGRYLTSSSHFSKNEKRVKPNAFMPMRNARTKMYETSVFNISGLNSNQVKDLANKNLLPNLRKGRSIYGTADNKKMNIEAVGLKAEVAEPPVKHVNIVGWPDEKSKQKQLAMELAGKCTLSLFGVPIEK